MLLGDLKMLAVCGFDAEDLLFFELGVWKYFYLFFFFLCACWKVEF